MLWTEVQHSTFYSVHMFPLLTFLLPDVLPVPTLILQRQTDVWHLLCTGSPAYPGAVFSLYLADSELPAATKHATLIHHHAIFPVPVQDTPVALYQCQYSVLMGRNWSTSERSLQPTDRFDQYSCVNIPIYYPFILSEFSQYNVNKNLEWWI